MRFLRSDFNPVSPPLNYTYLMRIEPLECGIYSTTTSSKATCYRLDSSFNICEIRHRGEMRRKVAEFYDLKVSVA